MSDFAVDIALPDFEGKPCESWRIYGKDLKGLVKNVCDAVAGDMLLESTDEDYANRLSAAKVCIVKEGEN